MFSKESSTPSSGRTLDLVSNSKEAELSTIEKNYVPEIIKSAHRLLLRKSVTSSNYTHIRGTKKPQLSQVGKDNEISQIKTFGPHIDDVSRIENDGLPEDPYIPQSHDIPSDGPKTYFLVAVVTVVGIACVCLLIYQVIHLILEVDVQTSKPGNPDGINNPDVTGKPGGSNNTNVTCITNYDEIDWCKSQYCIEGFEQRGDYCYQFFPNPKTFSEAQSWCVTIGATLAEPRNSRENEAIFNFASEKLANKSNNWSYKDTIWIGVTDLRNEGTFEYMTGDKATYTNWLGTPSNSSYNLDCVQLIISTFGFVYPKHNNKKWVTSLCNPQDGLSSVCQQVPSGCCSVTDQPCLPTTCTQSSTSKPRQMALIENIPVVCDTETDGGNWVIIQRRTSQKVSFQQLWNEYANGFGRLCPSGNFWLGLDKVQQICGSAQDHCEIRFDMEFEGKPSADYVLERDDNKYYATYDTFYISNQTDNYRITISGYSGTAGDSLGDSRHSGTNINNVLFSTRDKDNDKCAHIRGGGGWWNYLCGMTNLNGRWASGTRAKGVIWYTLTQSDTSVTFSEIKIRRRLGG